MQSRSDMKALHPDDIGEPLEFGSLGESEEVPAMLVLSSGHVRYVTIHCRTMVHDGEGKLFHVVHKEDEVEWRTKWGIAMFGKERSRSDIQVEHETKEQE